jgi:peroxiredoxin
MKFISMSIRLIVILLGFIFSCTLSAQERSFLPQGLHKLTAKEQQNVQINLGLPMYLEDGTKLDGLESMKAITGPEYGYELHGNSNGELVAIVLIKLPKEQSEARLKQMMNRPDMTGEKKGTAAPSFIAKNMKGERIDLDELKGSLVVLNFWFIGCKPCQVEIPELNELVEKYKNENVKFVAFALDDQAEIENFLNRKAFNYDIVPTARNVAQIYQVSSYPSHYLIDREGNIQFFQAGYHGVLINILDKKIEEMLK